MRETDSCCSSSIKWLVYDIRAGPLVSASWEFDVLFSAGFTTNVCWSSISNTSPSFSIKSSRKHTHWGSDEKSSPAADVIIFLATERKSIFHAFLKWGPRAAERALYIINKCVWYVFGSLSPLNHRQSQTERPFVKSVHVPAKWTAVSGFCLIISTTWWLLHQRVVV